MPLNLIVLEPYIFKRWTNKKYAVLSSFHKLIRIGTLSLSSVLLQLQPVLCQSDTLHPRLFYTLEEVEALGEQETEILDASFRQLLIINRALIDPVSSRSIAEFLDYFPGIDIRTRGSHGIQSDLNIQGGSFDQSLVLLNGIDMSDPQTGHFSLDLPLGLSQAQKIEILKGPSSKKYGAAAYSGAVNIITQPKDSFGIQANAAYGQFKTYSNSLNVHIPSGKLRTLLSASLSGSEGYRENTDFSNRAIYLHSIAENSTLKADFMLGWNQKDFGANSFYTPRFPDQYEETSSSLAVLKIRTKKTKPLLEGQFQWRRHSDHFLLFRNNPSAYENYHLTDVLGATANTKFSSAAGVTSLGIKYRHEQIYSTNLGEILDEPVKVRGSENSSYDMFKSRDHVTLSGEQKISIHALKINVGVLAHAGIKDVIDAGVYPGIDVSLSIPGNLKIFTSANRSFRLPTFTDLYYQGPQNMGNPELLPEKAITLETGLRFVDSYLQGDLSFYYRIGQETIDWIWMDSIWQTTNITDLTSYGAEIGLGIFPAEIHDNLSFISHFRLAYSYNAINKSSDEYVSNYALDNLKHKFIADLGIEFPYGIFADIKINWQDRNGSFQYYSSPTAIPYESPYDPYWLIDFSGGIKIKGIVLYLDATNLLNTMYRDIGNVEMPGRWLMSGAKITL